MKQGFISSYIAGIRTIQGESFATIFKYFVPEYITALLLYSIPFWIDAYFVSYVAATPEYATLGITNNLLHLLIKIAEAFSVGTIILTGHFNGKGDRDQVALCLRDSFWITCLIGSCIAASLFFGASYIYQWYGVPTPMIALGVPFLRIRSIGVLFSFIAFAFMGFFRGIKNTKFPMLIFVIGSFTFLWFDYLFIFGAWGFPALGLQGSAYASVIQYIVMVMSAVALLVCNREYQPYSTALLTVWASSHHIQRLLRLSWPVLIDKATMACAYIWLCKMICPLGTCGLATFCVIKDMERFAFLPAVACAQVITFLVSNDMPNHDWDNIKANIKKIIAIAASVVIIILAVFAFYSRFIVQFFDRKGDFTELAVQAFPFLSVLVFLDVLQLILAGALRGSGNVRIVMLVRLAVVLFYFIPVSYWISQLAIENMLLKFILLYGTFYLGNGIMSLWYIYQFRSEKWKAHTM